MPKTAKKPKKAESPVLVELKKLHEFMLANQLETVEYSQGTSRVRLVRRPCAQQAVPLFAPANQQPQQHVPAPVRHANVIASPLTGIFYRAASPSSPPFIREGEAVKSGQVLCLIEAMKVFNEVKAEFDCVIAKVLVENGKPVKAGLELFAVDKK